MAMDEQSGIEANTSPSVWLFQANPKTYHLAEALQRFEVGDEDDWSVRHHRTEMRAGDTVVLWQSTTNPGIYAVGELVNEPLERTWEPTPEEIQEKPYLGAKWRVPFRYTNILDEPIPRDLIKQHPILGNMRVIKQPQGTNYRVTPEEWAEIQDLLGGAGCWKISPGERAFAWNEFRERNIIAIGWQGYGDLRPAAPSTSKEIKRELVALQDEDGGDPGYVSRQLWYLYGEMKPGDTVFAYGNKQILDRGEIVDEYVFEEDDFSYPHRRGVRWLGLNRRSVTGLSRELQDKLARPRTITQLTPKDCRELRGLMTQSQRPPAAMPSVTETIERTLAARGLRFTPWQIATFYTALQTKGFVILSGISGTGKTKLAQHFAGMLPQPQAQAGPVRDQIVITVKPYMLRYNRFIIPKSALKYFEFPPPGETRQVEVAIEERHQLCRLTHNETGSGTYLSLLLKGQVRERFTERFSAGSQFVLEPELDEDQAVNGFRLTPGAAGSAGDGLAGVSDDQNTLFLSVRPDWRDSKNLLGYLNPLTGTYQWTPFLRFLLRAAESYRNQDGLAWFVVLDEMNLAHVEYYFADLLSVLESGRDAQGWTNESLNLVDTDEAPEDLPPTEIRLPPNLYVVGTVNVDETTRAFSPKVLDRAFSMELSEVSFTDYPSTVSGSQTDLSDDKRLGLLDAFTLDGTFARVEKEAIAAHVEANPELRDVLQTLNERLATHGLHFGYRVFDEIVAFAAAAEKSGVFSQIPGADPALDSAVLAKVLPKFHGARSKLEAPLKALLAWCRDPLSPNVESIEQLLQGKHTADEMVAALSDGQYLFPRTAHRALAMLRDLYTEGFAAFG